MPLILVSAEKTCAFNNNKLFKRFKEKLAVTPGAITCIPALVHEKMEIVTLHTRMFIVVYTSSHRRHQKFQWEGGPRGGNFQGDWVRFSRSFLSRDFETRIIVFIDDLTLTVTAE